MEHYVVSHKFLSFQPVPRGLWQGAPTRKSGFDMAKERPILPEVRH